MTDISSICYVAGAALGIASCWVSKLVGPAVAALCLGLLFMGK